MAAHATISFKKMRTEFAKKPAHAGKKTIYRTLSLRYEKYSLPLHMTCRSHRDGTTPGKRILDNNGSVKDIILIRKLQFSITLG